MPRFDREKLEDETVDETALLRAHYRYEPPGWGNDRKTVIAALEDAAEAEGAYEPHRRNPETDLQPTIEAVEKELADLALQAFNELYQVSDIENEQHQGNDAYNTNSE